jgi:hypothetical protein
MCILISFNFSDLKYLEFNYSLILYIAIHILINLILIYVLCSVCQKF